MILPWMLKMMVLLIFIASGLSEKALYYGLQLGKFEPLFNKVGGEVFAVDDNLLFIKGFSYDGQSEDAVFWAGTSEYPDNSGFIIPTKILPIPAFNNEDILLRLPKERKVKRIQWLSVWNRNTSISLGTLIFPKFSATPHPLAIGPLVNTKEGLSTGDILILDSQTFFVTDFNYDNSGKEVYWWLSNGTKPNEFGIRLLENERDEPLQESQNTSVILTLPNGHFVMDYDTLSLWDVQQGQDLGFVDVPKNLNVPPSTRILGKEESKMEEFNCEMLNDNLGLELRWLIKGDEIIIHLIGNIGLNEYMTLGLSKDDSMSKFDSSDAIVAGIDSEGRGYAIDYFFESNERCENGSGMCPDSIYGSDDNLGFVRAEKTENSTVVIFKRLLKADDKVYDQIIYTDGPQAILWAVGPMNSDGFPDKPTLQSGGNLLLDFGREPNWNCPPSKLTKTSTSSPSEENHRIHCPADRSFRAQIGSSTSSNEHKVWYINGLPKPDLTVHRGVTYTFTIEGGTRGPIHHPFYITSSKEGGLLKNIIEASDVSERTFAGVGQDSEFGHIIPTAEGRLCDWTFLEENTEYSVVIENNEIRPVLRLACEFGQPGKLMWTPSWDTPTVVYYQSFNEKNIGGKIRVVDFCEESNPQGYLQAIASEEESRYPQLQGIKLEREIEDNVFTRYSNMKTEEKLSAGEATEKFYTEKEHFKESFPDDFIFINTPPDIDTYELPYNIANSLRRSSDEDSESSNETDGKQISDYDNITNSPLLQIPKNEMNDTPFPHDESERSDTFVRHRPELPKTIDRNQQTFASHRYSDDRSAKQPVHSSSEISSIPALSQPRDFKPHFEGGFVPLVVNPMKEKEFAPPKERIHQIQPRSKPYRPFLYNESVPFHGTFKPGVPDFSGFNISNYSQEDASIITAPNQESVHHLSVSRPHAIHKRVYPIGHIPQHLLQNPNAPPQRQFQRPQEFGLRYHPQNPSFNDPRKNGFPHLPLSNKPKRPIPNIKDDDLAEVSSQRVYMSLQTSGDKSQGFNIPTMQSPLPYNPLYQTHQPRKVIYPPAIQRRPDFYDEREPGFNRKNQPPRKFIPQGTVSNLNKYNNQQKLNLPPLKEGGLFGQLNIRQQGPSPNIHPKSNLPIKTELVPLPLNELRLPYPLQVPLRERIPQQSVQANGIPIRQVSQMNQNLRLNIPQNGNRFALPLSVSNIKGKQQENIETSDYDSSSEEETRSLPVLVNAELVEVPNKIMPSKDGPIIYSSDIQNTPLNLSTSVFTDQPNTRNTFPEPNSNQPSSNPKHLPFRKVHDSLLSFEDKTIGSISIDDKIPNPIKSSMEQTDTFDAHVQDSQSSRSNMKKQEEGFNKNSDSEKPNIHSSQFGNHEFDETVHEGTEFFASSHSIKTDEVQDFPDYGLNSEDSQIKDSVLALLDPTVNKAEFGARLKFPQNGTKLPMNILTEISKSSFETHSKPNFHANMPTIFSTTATKSDDSSNPRIPVIIKQSVSSSSSIKKQENTSPENVETVKLLYYTPPFSSIIPEVTNESGNQQSFNSDDMKHIPIIADPLEGYIETKYLRKNILPNISNSTFPLLMMPPKYSDNINLPHISENPPIHDNGTDYSILNHIMTLIGGPSESKNTESSS